MMAENIATWTSAGEALCRRGAVGFDASCRRAAVAAEGGGRTATRRGGVGGDRSGEVMVVEVTAQAAVVVGCQGGSRLKRGGTASGGAAGVLRRRAGRLCAGQRRGRRWTEEGERRRKEKEGKERKEGKKGKREKGNRKRKNRKRKRNRKRFRKLGEFLGKLGESFFCGVFRFIGRQRDFRDGGDGEADRPAGPRCARDSRRGGWPRCWGSRRWATA
jgi:hypothetical protein